MSTIRRGHLSEACAACHEVYRDKDDGAGSLFSDAGFFSAVRNISHGLPAMDARSPNLFGGCGSRTARQPGTTIAQRGSIGFTEEPTMPHVATDRQEYDLRLRIQAEFAEMPGLKLTLPQASRLFNVDADRCERALDRLVEIGSLWIASGAFVRAGGGRHVA